MTQAVVIEPVRKSFEVELPPLEAFQLFTSEMAVWWPATHHIGPSPFIEIVIEPRAGGGWFEVDQDGTTCQRGSILAWDPPQKLVLTWGLQSDWKFDPDLSKSSEVEVRFVPMGDSATLVEFENTISSEPVSMAGIAAAPPRMLWGETVMFSAVKYPNLSAA